MTKSPSSAAIPPPALPSIKRWMRLLGMTFATAAGSAALAAAPDGLQATTLAAVVYLNGMRIHADNCGKPLNGGADSPPGQIKSRAQYTNRQK